MAVRNFLEKSEGIRVFGCGFDDVMVRLGRAFGYELPDLGVIQEREMEAFGEIRGAYLEIAAKSILNDATQLRLKEQWSSAVDQYQEYLKLIPKDFEAHLHLGWCLYKLNRHKEAVATYGIAIDLDPTHPWPHSSLGVMFMETNKYPEAEAEFREAIRLDPTNPFVYENLAAFMHLLGHHDEATALRTKVDSLRKPK